MFSKNQRRRQKDGSLICRECRKLLDSELVVVWSEDGDDDDDENEYGDEDVGEDGGGDGGTGEGLFGHRGFRSMKVDWAVDVEKDDPDWHNGSLNDMFL